MWHKCPCKWKWHVSDIIQAADNKGLVDGFVWGDNVIIRLAQTCLKTMNVYRQDCHSTCVEKKKMEDVSQKVGFGGIWECRGGEREWVVWGRRDKRRKKNTKGCERKGEREKVSNREQRVFSCISFLDSCLLDDRIKESFNMTSMLYFAINTPNTPLWDRSLYTQHAPCTARMCFTYNI